MAASRVLYPCQTRGSPVVVRCDFFESTSDRCDVRGAFDALDPRRSPCRSYATLAASTYIRSGSSPNQGPSCNIARAEGLQGRWDPSLGRRLAATPPGGHASTLDWYVLSLVFKTPCTTLINLSERRPSAPHRFPGSATRRSKACVLRQRWRCAPQKRRLGRQNLSRRRWFRHDRDHGPVFEG